MARKRRLGGGLVAGLVAFVAGYLLLFAVKGNQIMTNFFRGMRASGTGPQQFQEMGIALPEQWKIVGMVYHTLHNVPYSLSISRGGQSFTTTAGRGFMTGDFIPWLIPMLVLFVAGFVLASSLRPTSRRDGGITGASVAVGYCLAAVATSFVFMWSATITTGTAASISMGPDLLSTVIFTGLVFPIIFGGVGGIVAYNVGEQPAAPAQRPA